MIQRRSHPGNNNKRNYLDNECVTQGMPRQEQGPVTLERRRSRLMWHGTRVAWNGVEKWSRGTIPSSSRD